jgi:hypothetical protein
MAMIVIDADLEVWVEEKVVKRFKDQNFSVSPAAAQCLAYLLQLQSEEGMEREAVLQHAGELVGPILSRFKGKYESPVLTTNQLLHLITEVNSCLLIFPTWPTMHLRRTHTIEGGGVKDILRSLNKETAEQF